MKKIIKPIIAISIIIIMLIILIRLDLFDKIQLEKVKEFRDWLNQVGVYAYLLFILIYIIATVFALPGSTLTIFAGIIFGPIQGTIIAVFAATIGATVAFLLSRYLMRDYIVYKFKDKAVFQKIEDGFERHGKDFLIFTRLVPIFPFSLQNYAYGLTNMKLISYVVISFFTMIPGGFLYAYLAGDIVEYGLGMRTLVIFFIACIILFFISQLPKWFGKKKGIEVEALKESN